MSIPASDIVTVNPGVIGAGGNPLALNGVILSQNDTVPVKSVLSFPSAPAVGGWFGLASPEYALAQIYFLGYDNSTVKPGALIFAPYVESARAAWVNSGSFKGFTLAQIQALTGVLNLTVDGVAHTSSNINLSSATSFSNAATMITAAFTGSPLVCTWDAIRNVFVLTSATTGAASSMTYATGTLSAGLKLTSATGAILSQGADVDTATTAMDSVIARTQNWATFMTMWEPAAATDKEQFAIWANNQNQRYMYVAWDTDGQAIVNGSQTCFGALLKNAEYNGSIVVSGDPAATAERSVTLADAVRNLAAFVLGMVASIDFSRRNARITTAFKSQSGFVVTADDQQIAANLLGNGYSYYGSYATANDQFNFFYNGQMAGDWEWVDPYVNQIYMNAQFQLALMNLLTQATSVPYNQDGYNMIRAAMADPIQAAINFGGIRAGVQLSQLQAAEVNQAAGVDAASSIEQNGYFLQVLDPGAQARGNRESPIVNFWYTDGGAVQKIVVASIDIL